MNANVHGPGVYDGDRTPRTGPAHSEPHRDETRSAGARHDSEYYTGISHDEDTLDDLLLAFESPAYERTDGVDRHADGTHREEAYRDEAYVDALEDHRDEGARSRRSVPPARVTAGHGGAGVREWLRAPATLQTGRWSGSRSTLLAVAGCAVLILAVIGFRWFASSDAKAGTSYVARARAGGAAGSTSSGGSTGQPSSIGGVLSAPGAGSGSAGGAGTEAPGPGAPSSPTSWSVHVIGAVKHPGVVTVPAGSRVEDAVAAAGGLAANADPNEINLARQLRDGEQVHVPRPGEKWSAPADAGGSQADGGDAAAPAGGKSGAGSGSGGGPVNLNTANLAALDSLPGVGPVMAQRILDWRSQHGQFHSVNELGEVSGIGPKLLARLKPKVAV